MSCHICEGRETVESTVRFQIVAEQAPELQRPFIALCKSHYTEAESAYREIKRTQSAPISINLPGLRIGGVAGRT